MPIYEYHCSACGHDFEAMQKIGEDPLKLCPKCHGHEVKKVISATSFRLKGTGWYVTDFKGNQQKTEKKETKGKEEASTSQTSANDNTKKEKTENTSKKETKT